jgi:cyclopropane fatty-acyl-phospholipid synthase-like methyltransferase
VAASFSAREQEDARRRAEMLGVSGIEFRMLDLRELEDHRESLGVFDQVVCLETIEHVNDDEGLVRSLAAILAPGGRLLLTTPYDGHRPLYSEERHPDRVEDGSHVRYGYSRERLRQITQAAGLDVVSESFISGMVSQKLTDLMRRLSGRVGLAAAWAILLPLRPLVIVDGVVTRLWRYPPLCVAECAIKRS